VHCSAESLARDLEGLRAGGWQVRAIRLCDMFPHTDHVEIVTALAR
jgi:23S rRNA (uracil1939-C5)-methyltransferase